MAVRTTELIMHGRFEEPGVYGYGALFAVLIGHPEMLLVAP
jgi:hypothetical protein